MRRGGWGIDGWRGSRCSQFIRHMPPKLFQHRNTLGDRRMGVEELGQGEAGGWGFDEHLADFAGHVRDIGVLGDLHEGGDQGVGFLVRSTEPASAWYSRRREIAKRRTSASR